MGYPLGGKKKRGKGKKKLNGEAIMLDNPTLTQAHRYAIFNCGDEEVEKYITEHKNLIDSRRGSSKWAKAQTHSQDFVHWFEARVADEQVPDYICWLSKFPNPVARRYKGYQCVRFDVVKDEFGLTCVNFIKLCYMDDPFVLASQVHQVFYVQDPSKEERHYVLQNVPKDLVDLDQSLIASEESYRAEASNVGVDVSPPIGDDDVTWCRNDVALEMPFSVW
ncbi:hypothetical protein Dimus_010362 [Dionaea muscipula]